MYSYPFPMIDQLVDVTSHHELLNFMDDYAIYNQVKANEKYVIHTMFYADSDMYHYTIIPFRLINGGVTY